MILNRTPLYKRARIPLILTIIASYLAWAGVVSFTMFIYEEGIQTAMFSTWASKDAGDWQTVKMGYETMDEINEQMKLFNAIVGWTQPFAYKSYGAYARSAEVYIRAKRAEVLSRAPSLFIDEDVEFDMIIHSWEPDATSTGYIVYHGAIRIYLDDMPEERMRELYVTGTMQEDITGRLYIDMRRG